MGHTESLRGQTSRRVSLANPSVASNLQEKLPGSVRVHDRTGALHNQLLSHPLP